MTSAIEPTDREFFFAWEGAVGGWDHLRVVEFHGQEAISELYSFEIELHRPADAPDVSAEDLVGAQAALKMATRTEPGFRIIHGVVASAVELGDVEGGGRYRIVLHPPIVRAAIARATFIHIENTIRGIVDRTLRRKPLGAGLEPASGGAPAATGQLESYAPPKLTYEWRILNTERLDDPEARPYCVQYFEPDWAFCSRLLEEEGISYHFEHGENECRVVFTDFDGGRVSLDAPLGPTILGREIPLWHAGGRLRPRSVFTNDFNWRKPELIIQATSASGDTTFTDMEYPGRYEHSQRTGEVLANAREQRFDTERRFSAAEGRCRLLGAGTIFRLEHPKDRFEGGYLVTAIEHHGRERGWFAERPGELPPYTQRFECLRCSGAGVEQSNYRPALATPRPRIYGTQTAFVTEEPGSPDAEINVGGPSDIGNVRVAFHWDVVTSPEMREQVPSSCWIRVSQFFAGSNHGALWNPRVGDEVIVEFIDGDPDRPIVTGRVYNGTNLAPANATARPTYSAIQSLTSPYNGNYNLLSFEDLQGEELIHIHAARDMTIDIERNYTRNTKAHDAENAGSQSISVGSTQTIDVGTDQTITVGANQIIGVGADQIIAVGADQAIKVGGNQSMGVGANQTMVIGGSQAIKVGAASGLLAGDIIIKRAPVIKIGGSAIVHARGGSLIALQGGDHALLEAPKVYVTGSAEVIVLGGEVTVHGSNVKVSADGEVSVSAPTVNVDGGVTNVNGGSVNINGAGGVNISGGPVNLNC